MARKTREEAEATREAILLAALDLFSERGYSRATFSAIASRIGMTRGAVYWHFDNKTVLLAALIDYMHERNKERVGIWISDIRTLDDVRNALVSYAGMVMNDETTRRFEFFIQYQMEWSEELLTETGQMLQALRETPLEEFKQCFARPEVSATLQPGTDLDGLVLTLAAFWTGACKLYLSRCPGISLGQCTDSDLERLGRFDLAQAVGEGVDLILRAVSKDKVNGRTR